jgi:hypothetical protein
VRFACRPDWTLRQRCQFLWWTYRDAREQAGFGPWRAVRYAWMIGRQMRVIP